MMADGRDLPQERLSRGGGALFRCFGVGVYARVCAC